ncbi:hypothetical protein DRO57_04585 [Candidatus Bathyarchaeota archaeon]|nr:MAG: hypothetical protein DRO57_04585 [Candidatus Bathyarchaeota archaeon]
MIDRRLRIEEGEKAAKVALTIDGLLSLVKITVGVFSGITMLTADGLHGLADSVTSIATWLGLFLSKRKPTGRFPYGYYKAENLASLLVSTFILYTSYEVLLDGFETFFKPEPISMPFEATIVALSSALISSLLFLYLKKVALRIGSQSISAIAKEKMVDVLFAVSVVIGILLVVYTEMFYVEGVLTTVISIPVFYTGLLIMKDAVYALMDVSPSKTVEEKVMQAIGSVEGVIGFRDLKLRKSGSFLFGEVIIKVKPGLSVEKAHEVADKLEKAIKSKVRELEYITIHVEPTEKPVQKVAIPIEHYVGLGSRPAERFGRSKNILIATVNLEDKELMDLTVVKNPYSQDRVRAGLKTAKLLLKQGVDAVVTSEIGEIAYHTLRDGLVLIYLLEGSTVKEVLDRFMDKKLMVLERPTREVA